MIKEPIPELEGKNIAIIAMGNSLFIIQMPNFMYFF